MYSPIKVTILGSGTSQGVPIIGCECSVCLSIDPRDNRLRSSVLIEVGERVFVIDTGPDFRQQMLRAGAKRLDAVIYTHEHKDHVSGMDEVRAFNYIQRQVIPLYVTENVEKALKREFFYAFEFPKYPGVPEVELIRIENRPFMACGVEFTPILAYHHLLPVFGFRLGGFTYLTDANRISEEELVKMEGSEVLVINALRRHSHISHFTMEEALNIIERVRPERAYLTHISHQLGLHSEVEKELPPHVRLAHDGLQFTLAK